MKKWLFVGIVLISCTCGTAVGKKDPALERRLGEFLKVYEELDLEKMTGYIYPKVFTFVTREQLLESMDESIKQQGVKVDIDSLKIDVLYPVFEMDSARYAKAICSMVTILEDSSLKNLSLNRVHEDTSKINHAIGEKYPAPRATLLQTLLRGKYGAPNISIDTTKGLIKVHAKNQIIAIKDKFASEWSFLTASYEEPLPDKLFSKKVLEKLATYK